ncbi:MAG: hypothetical protein N4A49_08005 [Marinifilaceae bacterium]|jgi:hypothetical protein|nr:hypothetical protein [Marinifilaceae bacterium]
MRYSIYLVVIFFIASCTKDNFIDTGKPISEHKTTMLEYFKTDSYNWDSTLLVIKRADLSGLFEGKDVDNPQITFFGLTNHSIRRWMIDPPEEGGVAVRPAYNKVSEIPVDVCEKLILSHVLKGRLMSSEIPYGKEMYDTETYKTYYDGGMEITLMAGNKVWIGLIPSEYEGIPDAGYERLSLVKQGLYQLDKVNVASKNIKTNTGVVHSLEYAYNSVKLTDDIK